jgi:hypothetical protein
VDLGQRREFTPPAGVVQKTDDRESRSLGRTFERSIWPAE